MLGIYLSGTGNTKYCINLLAKGLESNAVIMSLDNPNLVKAITENSVIILGYPTQFSNAPYMVRDFIHTNSSLWKGKRILCVATMGAFSGDGAGCTARILKEYGAYILGGLHIRMPDSVCDSKLLKKSLEKNRDIVAKATRKIEQTVVSIKKGKYPKEGITFWAHLVGLFGQRLWFYNKTIGYSNKLKIHESCVGCGLCVKSCPMKNLSLSAGKVVSGGKCTMCYSCISQCPHRAITLLGEEVKEQCRLEKYL